MANKSLPHHQAGRKKRGHIMKVMHNDPDMLEEYDFSEGVIGKYAKRYNDRVDTILKI